MIEFPEAQLFLPITEKFHHMLPYKFPFSHKAIMSQKFRISWVRTIIALLFIFQTFACTAPPSASVPLATSPSPLTNTSDHSTPNQTPILKIDAGVHIEDISRIALDSTSQFLVTGSNDKTVKVWDINNQTLLRTLRPPIGPGHEGKIFAIALSPDGKTIACGGYTGVTWGGTYAIYIFDRLTGQLTKRLSNLPSSLGDLAFSPDGRLLLAGLHGRTGWYAYRTSDFALVAKDESYYPTSYVYGLAFDSAGRFATTSYDGFIRLYEYDFQLIAKVQPEEGQRPYGIAFSPDGKQLAVGYENSSNVVVLSGNDLKPWPHQPKSTKTLGTFSSVTWSKDGTSLYAAGTARDKKKHVVRKWAIPNFQQFSDIPITNNTILDLIPWKSGGVAVAGASGAVKLLDAKGNVGFTPEVTVADFRDNHQALLLSEDGSIVQFGYAQFGKDLAQFSLQTRVLSVPPQTATRLNPPILEAQGIRVEDWKNLPSPKLNNIQLKLDSFEVARSMAIAPDHQSILFGTSWNLRLYDLKGRQIWQRSIPDNAWGVNISIDKQVAIATLGDGTIRWYRLKDGKELITFFPHADRERWVVWTPSGYYDAAPGAERLIGWHKNYEVDFSADFFPIGRFRSISYRPEIIETMLATWDEQESFRLTKNSSKTLIPNTVKLVSKDIVKKIGALQEKLEHSVAENQKNASSSPDTNLSASQNDLFKEFPPEIIVFSPQPTLSTSNPVVSIHYAVVTHPHAPVKNVSVLIDGQPLPTTRGIRVVENIPTGHAHQTLDVPIPARNCTISLVASHQWATSEPATIKVQWEEKIDKPNLYVLAIGPGGYANATLNVPTASADAESIAATLIPQSQRLYNRVETKVLINAEATKANILDGLDWLYQQTTQQDVAIIFFAGHAVTDKGGIPYLLTTSSDLAHLRRTSLSLSDITNAVTSMAGKSLLFLDPCQANTPPGSIGCIQGVNSLSQDLGKSTNAVIAFLASSGSQRAIHNPELSHSAFTTALIEGLSGRLNSSESPIISLNRLELQISERVRELTQGYQRPTTIKPQTIQDFPVALALSSQAVPPTTQLTSLPKRSDKGPAQAILTRLPPVVTIVSPSDFEAITSSHVTIRYSIRNPSGEPVTDLIALIDGRPIPKTRGIRVTEGQPRLAGVQEYSLTVPHRDSTVSLIAKNRWTTSEPASVRLRWKGVEPQQTTKPKLNILAIGISAYADSTLTLDFAAKDAQDFSKVLQQQEGGLYQQVNFKLITNQDATKDLILEGLDWIDANTSPEDLAMIFLAGHGVNDSGGIYYFLPVDADTQRLRRTALPYSDIKNTISSLNGKTLLFVDSCHAGNIMGMRRGVADINALVNELSSAENGAVVFASSTGRQFALEDPSWGNGAFTKALLEGFQGGADYRKNGVITVNMLDLYLSERVKILTKGQQTPTTTKPQTIQDFPIAVTPISQTTGLGNRRKKMS